MEQTFNFWVFGDSFGSINDIGYSYNQLKKKYPSISDRQQLVNSEWPKHIAEHFGYVYDSKFNQAKSARNLVIVKINSKKSILVYRLVIFHFLIILVLQ